MMGRLWRGFCAYILYSRVDKKTMERVDIMGSFFPHIFSPPLSPSLFRISSVGQHATVVSWLYFGCSCYRDFSVRVFRSRMRMENHSAIVVMRIMQVCRHRLAPCCD